MAFSRLATAEKGEVKMSEEDKIMSQIPESMRQLRRFVKDKISDKWEVIAIQLDFTIAQIQRIKDNHKERSVVTCCLEMLFHWVDNTKSKDPANDLVEAIREVEFGYQADLIEKEMKQPNSNILELGYLQAKIVPEIAVKWYEIGLELDIPASKLEAIKNERDHCGARCFEMLQMWFHRGEKAKESERPSWKNMDKAMRAVDLNFRADNLKKLVLKTYMGNDDMDTAAVDIN